MVQADWLSAHLLDPRLRIFDCTAYLHPAEGDADAPYRVESGFAAYQRGHIPGAGFLDLKAELSDLSTGLRFMRPLLPQFVRAMSRHGVGPETRVVLYSRDRPMWATRIWWMLRAFGFDNATVLDGGWNQWLLQKHSVSTADCTYPAATFVPQPRPELFADKQAVLEAINDDRILLINALNPSYHLGNAPSRYGRPGRIPSSINLYAGESIDPKTHTFVSLLEAKKMFDAIGAPDADRIFVYCGSGISATINLFMMHRLGYNNIALYDGSMNEWAPDESLPIEIG